MNSEKPKLEVLQGMQEPVDIDHNPPTFETHTGDGLGSDVHPKDAGTHLPQEQTANVPAAEGPTGTGFTPEVNKKFRRASYLEIGGASLTAVGLVSAGVDYYIDPNQKLPNSEVVMPAGLSTGGIGIGLFVTGLVLRDAAIKAIRR